MSTATRLSRSAVAVLSAALALRLLAVAVTSLTNLNTYATYDADGFARSAAEHAAVLASGRVPILNLTNIYDVWGLFLSPFWLLPGPSRVYARLGGAVIGTIAVYNVYVVAWQLGSERAGIIAALPMTFFPSFLFIHSTVLREAAVLVGLTTAARLLIAPPPRLSVGVRWALALVCLAVATVLRIDNLPLYLLAIGIVFAVRLRTTWPSALVKSLGGVGVAIGAGYATIPAQSVINYLAKLRRYRARGRTEYLSYVAPDTLSKSLAFSWIGGAYFLFAPFAWMITGPALFVTGLESLVTLVMAYFAIKGTRYTVHRSPAVTIALVITFLIGVLFYGLATANVGTAVRHRQMFTWVLFLFGGVGLAITIPEVSVKQQSNHSTVDT